MKRIFATLALLLAGIPAALGAQFEPFDEAARDASLVTFRQQVLDAVERHDFEALKPLLSKDIELSFGGHYGLATAKQFFAERPRLWHELGRVLRNGGGFRTVDEPARRIFVAPYTFFADPPGSLDVFDIVVLAGENIPVYANPSTSAPVIARYSHEIVPINRNASGDEAWQAVKLDDGRTGFVERKSAVSPIDYRAGIEKRNDGWKVVFFLAGD